MISKVTGLGMHVQGEHAQLTLHVFDIELLLDLLRVPAFKAQQVFEKLVAGNMVTGVQVSILCHLLLAFATVLAPSHVHPMYTCISQSLYPTPVCTLSSVLVMHLLELCAYPTLHIQDLQPQLVFSMLESSEFAQWQQVTDGRCCVLHRLQLSWSAGSCSTFWQQQCHSYELPL